ncbi:hypothetical protein SAMN04488570_1607 [Nocardioides scoriae]|uniref:Uncharacterized protein n=1 Tax=Nocardioides scoriae TaxID=642780 RepID=A0A1H1R6T7_9ACTN|nr:hypothetical protein [Nocardioides scoriae]SDS31448.1 hypothetical protein SAMN04488570_1607 [Nocardioides scoriae]
MSPTLVARTGLVTPAPDGPHVEQVGWGVARQVARVLGEALAAQDREPPAVLAELSGLAERPGFVAYVVFAGRTATAAALVQLAADDELAVHLGDVVVEPDPGRARWAREALVVRALHDAAAAGVPWLAVAQAGTGPGEGDVPHADDLDLRPLGFG